MYPVYLQHKNVAGLADELYGLLASCCLCPRLCKVDRLKGEQGYCKTGSKARVYSYMPHFGEEPPLSGTRGSGTIFFSGCTMGCVYCQNHEFSQSAEGREVEPEELADIMLELQHLKCHNINLVSPTHVLPQILKALSIACGRGLSLPLVYNTGGYELSGVIRRLDNIVDIYLPDMRYGEERMAAVYSAAENYVEHNRRSVKEMHRQVREAVFNEDGTIAHGLIIRHLVLPRAISGTESIMKFIAEELSVDTYVSLMSQYLPCYKAAGFKDIARRVTYKEYEEAQNIMQRNGLHNGWTQESHGLARFAGVHIKRSF